ncbi:MAG: acyl-CoA thioesterase [Halomonadaceae bacterium]|nr:MAG: acyl-CoA thioesterase [Halomonadaceae bacterium]
MAKDSAPGRDEFVIFKPVTTRWMDNDIYGHVNNVTYYSYFDTAVNHYLIESGGLDIHNGEIIAFVVNSSCQYFQPVAYPDNLEVGLRVDRLGNSSVQYGVSIFRQGEQRACAHGQFVHVFVQRQGGSATPIPAPIREALARLSQPTQD